MAGMTKAEKTRLKKLEKEAYDIEKRRIALEKKDARERAAVKRGQEKARRGVGFKTPTVSPKTKKKVKKVGKVVSKQAKALTGRDLIFGGR